MTYDTGALVAAERGDRRVWARYRELVLQEVTPTVPAAVLAQAWRGGPRSARLSRFLGLCQIEPLTEGAARAVGELAGRARAQDIVDVSVVEGAMRRDDVIVTSDVGDLERIARAAGVRLRIEPV